MPLAARSTNFSYFELLDACKEPGCPICRLGNRSAQRHLTALIYGGVNDVTLRATLRDSYGYCHEHAWKLPESGESAPLGIAIIHRDILRTLHARLAEEAYDRGRPRGIRGVLSGAAQAASGNSESPPRLSSKIVCPACDARRQAEQLAFTSFLEALDKADQAMCSALESSDGLCLDHLRQALSAARSRQAFDAIVAITQAQLAALLQDLDEFIRKSDHRFREEKVSAEEGSSWRRALQRVSRPKPDQAAR